MVPLELLLRIDLPSIGTRRSRVTEACYGSESGDRGRHAGAEPGDDIGAAMSEPRNGGSLMCEAQARCCLSCSMAASRVSRSALRTLSLVLR